MAANIITVNSAYKPFSFDELLKPYQLYGQAYAGVESGLSNLETQASLLDSLKNNQGDINSYNQYKGYADNLKSQIDALTSGGLSPSLRAGLLNSRAQYAKVIEPINKMVAKRDTLAAEQAKMMAQNPDLRFDNDFSKIGIDQMMKNPSMQFRSVDLMKIYQKVGTAAEKLGSKLRGNPKYSKILNNLFWQEKRQQGYTDNEIMMAIASDPKAPKELRELYNAAWRESSGPTWSPEIQNEIKGAINNGMLFGIGQTMTKEFEDPEAIENMRMRKALSMQRQLQQTPPNNVGLAYGVNNINLGVGGNNKELSRISELGKVFGGNVANGNMTKDHSIPLTVETYINDPNAALKSTVTKRVRVFGANGKLLNFNVASRGLDSDAKEELRNWYTSTATKLGKYGIRFSVGLDRGSIIRGLNRVYNNMYSGTVKSVLFPLQTEKGKDALVSKIRLNTTNSNIVNHAKEVLGTNPDGSLILSNKDVHTSNLINEKGKLLDSTDILRLPGRKYGGGFIVKVNNVPYYFDNKFLGSLGEQAANEFLSIPAYKEYLENEYKKRGSDPRYADYYRELYEKFKVNQFNNSTLNFTNALLPEEKMSEYNK